MKITDNVFKGTEFKELNPGTTFKRDNKYYIKTNRVLDGENNMYNAVKLNDGTHVFVGVNEIVYPFMSELIVLKEV